MAIITSRRREGIERVTIGPILTTVTGVILLIVLIPALLLSLWDVIMQILFNQPASGRRMVFHQYWLWVGHNGSRMLYGEPDSWAYTPPSSAESSAGRY